MTCRALLMATFATGAIIWTSPVGAQLPRDADFIVCSSSVSEKYSGTGRRMGWGADLKVPELLKAGYPAAYLMVQQVESRFASWMRATGQFGRWNSISDADFGCSFMSAADFATLPARRAQITDADRKTANLPADWYKRDPKDPKEIAKYSTGTAALGSDVASAGSLTVSAVTPPVEPGWDAKVREGQRRDAADRIRAAAGTEKMRQESQVALARLLAELKKRGTAQ